MSDTRQTTSYGLKLAATGLLNDLVDSDRYPVVRDVLLADLTVDERRRICQVAREGLKLSDSGGKKQIVRGGQHKTSKSDCYISQRMMADLDYMEDTLVYRDNSGSLSLEINEVLPMVELMIDGQLRYGYEENDLIHYMMDLLVPVEGYEPQQEELQ